MEQKLRVYLSDLSYTIPNRLGRVALRFTLTWEIGNVGTATEGCLASFSEDGDLRWSYPMSRIGPGKTKQYHWCSPGLYQMVLKQVQAIAEEDRMRGQLDWLKSTRPTEENLPKGEVEIPEDAA